MLKTRLGWTIHEYVASYTFIRIEDCIVSEKRFGNPIGTHLGKPIYDFVIQSGKKYIFDRLAECDAEGCPLDQLKKGELLFVPGLIYKKS